MIECAALRHSLLLMVSAAKKAVEAHSMKDRHIHALASALLGTKQIIQFVKFLEITLTVHI